MKRTHLRRWPEHEGADARLLTVAAAVIGSAVVGAAASSSASSKAEGAANRATEAQSRSADAQAQLGYDQLEFNKLQYEEGRAGRDAAEKRAQEVSDAQLASMKQNDAIAKDYYDYSKETFRPLEQGLVADATNFDTADRRAQAAAEASAGVETSFGNAQQATARAIGRTGGTVGGGRTASLMQDFALAKAKADAGATTSAVKNVETQGWARRMDASSLGRNLPSNQATSASVAAQAGNSSVGNAMQAVAAQAAGVQTMNGGFAGASNSIGSAGSLYGQVANAYGKQAQRQQEMWGAIGEAGGNMAAMYMSDEDVKSGTGKPLDGEEALAQIRALDVDKGWRYDAAKGGPDDGRQHDGPMAQTVRRVMGEEVAPGGKQIDIPSMNGRILGAMQAIARRLENVELKVQGAAA